MLQVEGTLLYAWSKAGRQEINPNNFQFQFGNHINQTWRASEIQSQIKLCFRSSLVNITVDPGHSHGGLVFFPHVDLRLGRNLKRSPAKQYLAGCHFQFHSRSHFWVLSNNSTNVSTLDMNELYHSLRKRFLDGSWNPKRCSLDEIRLRFSDYESQLQQRNISFAVFDTLFRRAACEAIAESWKQTRLREKGHAAAIAAAATEAEQGSFLKL